MKPYDVIDVMTTTGKKKGPETHLQGIQSTSPSGAAGKAMTKICKIQKLQREIIVFIEYFCNLFCQNAKKNEHRELCFMFLGK